MTSNKNFKDFLEKIKNLFNFKLKVNKIIKPKLSLFFDLGCQGGVAVFEDNKLHNYQKFELTTKKSISPQKKVGAFYDWMRNNFKKPDQFSYVGTYEPLKISYRTVINLSFLVGLIMLYFRNSVCILLNEAEVYRFCLGKNIIPLRIEKKKKTIAWVNQKFHLQITNDDVADAIAGGYFLTVVLARTGKM